MFLARRVPHWARLVGAGVTLALMVGLLAKASETGDVLAATIGLVGLAAVVAVAVATKALSRLWPAPPLLVGATDAVVGSGLAALALSAAIVALGVLAAAIALGVLLAVIGAALDS